MSNFEKQNTKKTYYINASIKGSREASFSEVLIAMFQKLHKLNLYHLSMAAIQQNIQARA